MPGSIGTLFVNATHARTFRLRAAAAIAGVEWEVKAVNMHEELEKPSQLTGFITPMVPSFASADGNIKLTQSSAIVDWLGVTYPSSGLIPHVVAEAAEVRQWLSFADSELFSPLTILGMAFGGKMPPPIMSGFERRLVTIEKAVTDRDYIVGHSLTAADLTVVSALHYCYSEHVSAEVRAKYPASVAYFHRIISLPKLAPIYGKVELLP